MKYQIIILTALLPTLCFTAITEEDDYTWIETARTAFSVEYGDIILPRTPQSYRDAIKPKPHDIVVDDLMPILNAYSEEPCNLFNKNNDIVWHEEWKNSQAKKREYLRMMRCFMHGLIKRLSLHKKNKSLKCYLASDDFYASQESDSLFQSFDAIISFCNTIINEINALGSRNALTKGLSSLRRKAINNRKELLSLCKRWFDYTPRETVRLTEKKRA